MANDKLSNFWVHLLVDESIFQLYVTSYGSKMGIRRRPVGPKELRPDVSKGNATPKFVNERGHAKHTKSEHDRIWRCVKNTKTYHILCGEIKN